MFFPSKFGRLFYVALPRPLLGGEDSALSRGRMFLANFANPGFVFQNRFNGFFLSSGKIAENRGFSRNYGSSGDCGSRKFEKINDCDRGHCWPDAAGVVFGR